MRPTCPFASSRRSASSSSSSTTTAVAAVTALVALSSLSTASPVYPAADELFAQRRALLNSPQSLLSDPVDYVIIGGGTAGLTLAARLSEDSGNSVAVLEAGSDGSNDPRIDVPGFFGAGINTVYDWNMTAQPGTGANSDVPAVPWPRGRVLGGSSAINFLVWDRASYVEFDAWEELGSPGWNWEFIYKYLRRVETFTAPSVSNSVRMKFSPFPTDYGMLGALQASFPQYVSEQVSNWLPALNSIGIPTNPRANGYNLGAAQQPAAINPDNSTRSYSASAFLWPNAYRSNLKVLTGALVDKINFAPGSGNLTATGVVFRHKGQTYTVPVKKEVILSAGTVMSPAVLERSGVGSKAVLQAAGIKQLIDLPNVGENLQDHTYSYAMYELQEGHTTLDSLRNDKAFAAEQQAKYEANSPYDPSVLTEAVPSIAYITLDTLVGSQRAAQLTKDAQAYANNSTAPYKATLQKQVEFLTKYNDTVAQMELIGVDGAFAGNSPPQPGKNYVTFLAAQQHLLSRGTIHVNSSDPAVYPVIQPNYYSADWDRKVASAGTAFLRKIAGADAYASYIDHEVVPGAAVKTQADLEKYTTTNGFTTEYHPIGTLSLLPRNKGGVVSPELIVYGTTNVRAADASIIPLHLATHIQATTFAIGAAAADKILGTSTDRRAFFNPFSWLFF